MRGNHGVVCTPLQHAALAEEEESTERSIVQEEAQTEVVAEGEDDVPAADASPDETPSTAESVDVPAAEPLVDNAAAVAASAGEWVALLVCVGTERWGVNTNAGVCLCRWICLRKVRGGGRVCVLGTGGGKTSILLAYP